MSGTNLICQLLLDQRIRLWNADTARLKNSVPGRGQLKVGDSAGRDSLSRTGTGTITVIQTAALLAVFAVLGFAVKRFGRYHSRYRSDNVWTGAKRAADVCSSLGPSPSTVLLLYVYNGCSSNTCMACG